MHDDENYYQDSEDWDLEPIRKRGPLSKLPKMRHIRPAFFCFILFYIASILLSEYEIGKQLWASGQAVFENHEYWRLLTSLFTHSGLKHILSNALIFLIFGWLLKAYYGYLVFPIISFIIGILATLVTIALYEPHIRLVGASGMNYGMAALWLVFFIRYDIEHTLAQRIMRAAGFVMVMLLPSAYNPHISYLAHAVGFAIGIITGILLLPVIEIRDPDPKRHDPGQENELIIYH